MTNGIYQSELSVVPSGEIVFGYDSSSGTGTLQGDGAAVVAVDASYRTLTLGFPFADLSAADRPVFLERALHWMLPGDGCDDPYVRGDANRSNQIDIADAIFVLDHLFGGGLAPTPLGAGDANSDAAIDIADAIFLLGFLFNGGSAPAAPYPDPGC
ncbi:MAG: hypothetical protein AAF488_04460 [Planctomycetota bacterium]